MKIIASLVTGAAVLALASTAAAQEQVNVTGNAEAVCRLPDVWSFVSASYAAPSGGNFDSGSKTWTIPTALLADTSGQAVAGPSEVAVRIRGESFCNTAHSIQLKSQNGGLVAAAAPVVGFANRRTMRYDAYWSDGNSNAFGGSTRTIQNFVPTTAGAQRTVNYTITDTVPPPGQRAFDIRMSLLRTQANVPTQPLLSGAYEDVITVVLTPVS